jgi:hypothetical protein
MLTCNVETRLGWPLDDDIVAFRGDHGDVGII